ncbi:hypothetical protein FDI69_gp043 [Rhodococcus phage Trina]|uniref:YspA cpYpsA-related SLOG domain-containing protein n=1 Tax=Rhodococcus phage Trina TaxID=2027905 RepID=A0A2D1A6H3_9CAUD|nr:hypothetical protein FDI69_gp043 [Rhodococcus phage Trina]ASZ74860.1 hypothetical protein SEA_TRINA_43 [Rhodococcus phage Trina]
MTYNRILITGSREFNNYGLMLKVLTHAKMVSAPDAVLINGAAKGADTLAYDIWTRVLKMPAETVPADWDRYNKAAGPIRNRIMVDRGADICLAFPIGTSTGTRDCMKLAEKAGIKVVNITEQEV